MKKEMKQAILIVALVLVVGFTYISESSDLGLGPGSEDLWGSKGKPPNIACKNIDCLTKCIREVESGAEQNRGCGAIGDKGKSHGPYQIQKDTIDYASRYDKSLIGKKVTDLSGKKLSCDEKYKLSEKIMKGNWAQSATANADRRAHSFSCEDLARIHNGGPSGFKVIKGEREENLQKYWNKVRTCMCKKCPNDLPAGSCGEIIPSQVPG